MLAKWCFAPSQTDGLASFEPNVEFKNGSRHRTVCLSGRVLQQQLQHHFRPRQVFQFLTRGRVNVMCNWMIGSDEFFKLDLKPCTKTPSCFPTPAFPTSDRKLSLLRLHDAKCFDDHWTDPKCWCLVFDALPMITVDGV